MRALRHAVALVVVDFLVAVVQMQRAIIERASFTPPTVTTFGQYAVTMSSKTADDIDLYVRDPHGEIAWYGSLQAGALSLEHDQIPGVTDPLNDGVHELTLIRESASGEYVANVQVYNGTQPALVTVELWDLRGLHKRVILTRTLRVHYAGQQETAFRWMTGTASWRRRAPYIVCAPPLALALWLGRPDPAGWPSTASIPAHAQLLSAQVDEPDPSVSDRGHIYLWLDVGGTAPRAFALPYSRRLHEQVQHALQAVKRGRPMAVGRAVARGDHGRATPGRRSELRFYPHPLVLPPKAR